MIAVCAVVVMSGCSEDEATKIAKDPYLPTMMKDPLYTWRPAGDLSRTEQLIPVNTNKLASGTSTSRILITFTLRAGGNPDSLLQEAQRISTGAGYLSGIRVLTPGVNVSCNIDVTKNGDGLLIHLVAPV